MNTPMEHLVGALKQCEQIERAGGDSFLQLKLDGAVVRDISKLHLSQEQIGLIALRVELDLVEFELDEFRRAYPDNTRIARAIEHLMSVQDLANGLIDKAVPTEGQEAPCPTY